MWQLALQDDLVMTEDDVTSGEEELIFALATQSGVPHDWAENGMHPLHCPACLNATAIALLQSRGDRQGERDIHKWNLHAASLIAMTPRHELRACVTDVDRPEPTTLDEEVPPEPERVAEPIPA